MWHAPAVAWIVGSSCAVGLGTKTRKCWRVRNLATSAWTPFGTLKSPVCTANFQPSVKASSRTNKHLTTREELTPRTQHTYRDRKTKYGKICDCISPVVMYCFIIPMV